MNAPSPYNSEQAQAWLAAIVETSDDAIVSKNIQGMVQTWNRAAERIFGYTAQEMIGQSITRILPVDRLDEETDILNRIRRGERVDHFETVRRRKDGVLIDVSVTISPLKDSTGKVIGASKIARDITELKRIQKDRDDLLNSERAARSEAEKNSRVKDEFLATLSHELRTPLNSIMGWAHLLASGSARPDDLKQGLESIERNARTQTQLIEDLLDMSRIVSGKLLLDVRRVELSEVVDAAMQTVRPAVDAKGIRMTKVSDGRSAIVSGDAARLQQVIWNLLNNASKFTPRGGRIQVTLKHANSHVDLIVSDDGPGIEAEFLPHLFERFRQADASTTRKHGGLGLGLAIVRQLVELHGGTVSAQSEGLGKGATFVVSLPLTVLRSEDKGVTQDPDELDDQDLAGVKVLVVDDDQDSRALIKRVLETFGAKVLTADSAQKGLDAIKRERPTVLLSDIGMPERDGYDLLKDVRDLSEEEGGATPSVALTALARPEDRRRALLAGFQMHLPKPVDSAELVAVVGTLAGTRRGKRRS